MEKYRFHGFRGTHKFQNLIKLLETKGKASLEWTPDLETGVAEKELEQKTLPLAIAKPQPKKAILGSGAQKIP